MTDHFELSIMTGTRAISGSVADVVQERRSSRCSESSMPFVHVDVDEVRAAAHLLERHLRGRRRSRRRGSAARTAPSR